MSVQSPSLLAQHRGQWVVVDRAWTQVLGATRDPAECVHIARHHQSQGDVVIYRVPDADVAADTTSAASAPTT